MSGIHVGGSPQWCLLVTSDAIIMLPRINAGLKLSQSSPVSFISCYLYRANLLFSSCLSLYGLGCLLYIHLVLSLLFLISVVGEYIQFAPLKD